MRILLPALLFLTASCASSSSSEWPGPSRPYKNIVRTIPGTIETEDFDESGIVDPAVVADALLAEIKQKLESVIDPQTGEHPVLRCDMASEIYRGERLAEAPDLLVGYASGYGNSDSSSTGQIPHELLVDNAPASHGGKLGTFNGNHLMHPEVVPGLLLTNRPVREGSFRLEDLTVEILRQYGIEKPAYMAGSTVLE